MNAEMFNFLTIPIRRSYLYIRITSAEQFDYGVRRLSHLRYFYEVGDKQHVLNMPKKL